MPGRVHVTGNTAIDALLEVVEALPPAPPRNRTLPAILVTCHRRESWGAGVAGVAAAVRRIALDGLARIDVIAPPNAHVAATLEQLLGDCPGVTVLDPCSHRELVGRMRGCDLILSDSGGMQEEAPALGVPLLILRDKTERPEGIATGNMILVGTRTETIIAEVRHLLSDPAAYAAMARPAFPYGDGKAAPRIAAIVEHWLAERPAPLIRGWEPAIRS